MLSLNLLASPVFGGFRSHLKTPIISLYHTSITTEKKHMKIKRDSIIRFEFRFIRVSIKGSVVVIL